MKSNSILDAWLVIVLALTFGMALAAVHGALSPIISGNQLADTLQQIPSLVPGAERGEVENQGENKRYRAISANGDTVGWVVPRSGSGFADKITVLIGMDADLKQLTGLYVLQQSETPGLGDRIRAEEFRNRFKGVPTASELVVVKRPPAAANEIEGVTGATISSKSVVKIVNEAVQSLKTAATDSTKANP